MPVPEYIWTLVGVLLVEFILILLILGASAIFGITYIFKNIRELEKWFRERGNGEG